MNEKALVIQQKTGSLKQYLNGDAIRKSLEETLPKWLTIDRLLRVFMGAVNKNPALLDCTRESILISCMQCAQLGLEPILGRAWLVPYNNSKRINGQWVKVKECQMQPGYQGLIDLARRSNTISDIYGLNVYENDDFDISFGTDRQIHHRPWYMTKGLDGPEQIIGAYVVWLLKDGTKHPEFMHISDIHKRRDISKAYQAAIKYKEPDTPWLQWPEDMNLKTVIKHSSKMVPASIEFMQAVEVDNASETGKAPYLPEASDMFLPQVNQVEEGEKPQDREDNRWESLRNEILQKGVTGEQLDEFIEQIAQDNNIDTSDVEANAINDQEAFINGVLNSIVDPAQQLKTRMDEGDKEVEGYNSLNEKEKIQAGQAKLEEKREQEQKELGGQDSQEQADKQFDAIEYLRVCRPSASLKNAREAMKLFEKHDTDIQMLEDRNFKKQLMAKKRKTEDYLKQHEPPIETPVTEASQEQDERRKAFVKYCQDADKKFAEAAEVTGSEAPGLLETIFGLFGYNTLTEIKEVNFGEFKRCIRDEAAKHEVLIEE